MSSTPAVTITDEQKRQYVEEGYFVLERAIPEEHLEALRSECQRFIDMSNAEMDKNGTDVAGLNRRNNRYFIGLKHECSPSLTKFLFSPVMADVCRATLGPD